MLVYKPPLTIGACLKISKAWMSCVIESQCFVTICVRLGGIGLYVIANTGLSFFTLITLFKASIYLLSNFCIPRYSLQIEDQMHNNRWIYQNIFSTILFIKIGMAECERWLSHRFSIGRCLRVSLPMLLSVSFPGDLFIWLFFISIVMIIISSWSPKLG